MAGRRGRPLGYKLSDVTKMAIRASKQGQRHTQATKDKISMSLLLYFKKKNPLSKDIIKFYSRYDTDGSLQKWFNECKDSLNNSDDIISYKTLYGIERCERALNVRIEGLSHSITPELLVLFKEHCETVGEGMDELYDME